LQALRSGAANDDPSPVIVTAAAVATFEPRTAIAIAATAILRGREAFMNFLSIDEQGLNGGYVVSENLES
jgi:hypothetical protein